MNTEKNPTIIWGYTETLQKFERKSSSEFEEFSTASHKMGSKYENFLNEETYSAAKYDEIHDEVEIDSSTGVHSVEEEKTADSDCLVRTKPVGKTLQRLVFGSAFLVFGIVGGLHFTAGIFFVSMLAHFGESYSLTAWIGSLACSFFLLGGPIASRFITVFGCRYTLIFGSIVMAVGYLVSAFAVSLQIVLLGYGVIVSIGMCFCYTGNIVALSQYFDKRHVVVTSYAMAGNGIGLFGMTHILESLMTIYGWRLTFVACAAVSLQLAVLGSLFLSINKERTVRTKVFKDYVKSKFSRGFKSDVKFQKLEQIDESSDETEYFDRSMTIKNETKNFDEFTKGISDLEEAEKGNTCSSTINKKKINRRNLRSRFKRSANSVFLDINFWLVNLATAFIQGATVTVYVIYKDFFITMGLQHSYSIGLSLIGIGDVSGRLLPGILSSFKWLNPCVFYGSSMVATSFCLLMFLLPPSTALYLPISVVFGILYGIQNVYMAIIPGEVFGRDNLTLVLGQNLFWGGVGALFGAPCAGNILDKTNDYSFVIEVAAAICSISGILIFVVYGITKKRRRQ